MKSIKKRAYGAEQPYIKLGMFHIRIPFIHYPIELPEALTGIANGVCCVGGTAAMITTLKIPPEIAAISVIGNTITYILQVSGGDPIIPGWITPSIPLTMIFLTGFPEGEVRIKAMIALQLMVAAMFLFFGITGLANRIVSIVPPAIQGGIVLGAAVSAVFGELKPNGRFHNAPITVGICGVIAIFLLFSHRFKDFKGKIAFLLSKVSIIPALIVAMFVGPLVGEIIFPAVPLFPFFRVPDFPLAMQYLSPFCIGWPSPTIFLQAFPMACAVYIIAFGDLVTVKAIVGEAAEIRKDEYPQINLNRLNFLAGVRNLLLGLFCTFLPFGGPFGAPFSISALERYKTDDPEKGMYSLVGGMASNCIFCAITVCVIPITVFILPIASSLLSVLVMIQGFSCTVVGVNLCRDKTDLMIAGVMSGVIAAQGAAWGLGVGLLCYLLIANGKKMREDVAYSREKIRLEEVQDKLAAGGDQ